MKRLLIIIDGMDDEPIPRLGNMTPASYAHMPALDHMRSHGEQTWMQTIPEGCEPSTDIALMNILGCNDWSAINARSWFEALGGGIDVNKNDLCLRCNLIGHKDGIILSHCGFNPDKEESAAIIESLNHSFGMPGLEFYCFNNFRNLLVIRNCPYHVISHPPHTLIGQPVDLLRLESDNPDLEYKLNYCIYESRRILRGRKANGISLWASSHAVTFPRNVEGSIIAGVNIVKGIGHALGMTVVDVPGASGDESTDYSGKLNAAIEALKNDDFVVLHIEAPDEASHQRDWMKKVHILEKIDQLILRPVLTCNGHFQITVQSDHATSSITGQHLTKPVTVINYTKQK